MNARALVCALILACAAINVAGAEREARERLPQRDPAVSAAALAQRWQQRILAEDLRVEDPRNWSARNLPELAAFSAERMDLAMQAATIGELEALLVGAPVANGTSLALLMATKPGNISFDPITAGVSRAAVQKVDPSTSPTSYADLAFTALNPCRMLDSRVSQGGAGPFVNGAERIIKVGPFSAGSGGYATGAGAQGGSASGCGLDILAGPAQVAAVMVAISSFTQTGPGYLTFYSASTPDPSLTVVSMFYQGGPVQTAFVVIPTDLAGASFSKGISRSANTEVTIDIVGYFAKPHALALDCAPVYNAGATTVPLGGFVNVPDASIAACPAGFTGTHYVWQYVSGTGGIGVRDNHYGVNLGLSHAQYTNVGNTDVSELVGRQCCRVPGR